MGKRIDSIRSLRTLSATDISAPRRSSAGDRVDGEGARVRFGIARIERLAVEERLRRLVDLGHGYAELAHRLGVEIHAHDLLRDAVVVGRARDEAPATE